MIIREVGLRLKYFYTKLKYLGKVRFNGFTVVYAFHGSSIDFRGKGTVIHSSPLSNLLGIYQRTIIVARHGGHIEIGSNCGISGATIYAFEKIRIGEHCIIGANVKIIDSDLHPLPVSKQLNGLNPDDVKKAPIEISDGCFIGANSIILKGTSLGTNCIVGAGSVVHGTFPDNCIIAGNPAKIIKMQNEQ